MNILIIEDGKVVNSIKATLEEAKKAYPDSVVMASEEGAPGWTYNGRKLSPPATQKRAKVLNAVNVIQSLSEVEAGLFVDFLESNSVVSPTRAAQLKTKV